MRGVIAGILLAAGAARRFGSQKLLARLPDGRRVVEVSAENLRAAADRVIAVTRDDRELIQVLENCGCEIVVNPQADDGMGNSIAAGVAASRDAAGWLIALGDMPFLLPATIADIAATLERDGGIVVPTHHGQRGHPVAFSSVFGSALEALHGDTGARGLVASHPETVTLLPVEDDGVVADVDNPEDLPTYSRRHLP
ncbi:MAG: nucleotidyltransferase family protein [Betaproteobacteria bacterium]|nr:nucleotidyltransferase family protein [Betaproteobacteria bacterium]